MIKQLAAIVVAVASLGVVTITTSAAQDTPIIQIPTGFSTVLTLPSATQNVVVGNSDIADVAPFGQGGHGKFLLHAKKEGQTNLLVFDGNDQQLYSATMVISAATELPAARPRGYIFIHDIGQAMWGRTTYYCTPTQCQWIRSPPGMLQDISAVTPTVVLPNGTVLENPRR